MKVTMGMNYRMLSGNLENISNRLYNLRQQSASGKKFNKPSDNPGGVGPILNYRVQLETSERYANHMQKAAGDMQILDAELDQIENIFVRAKELGIAAMNATANDQDRQIYADELSSLFAEVLQAANGRVNGKYLFAGYQEKTVPFTENPSYDPDLYNPADSSTWSVAYNGDENPKTLELAPGETLQIGLTGNELFLGDVDNDQIVDAGAFDIFAVLKNFEDAVRDNDDARMNQGLEQLENAAEQVRRLRSQMGINAARIEGAQAQLEKATVEFQQVLSSYEDADVLDVFTRLAQSETAFEAALNVTAKVSRLTILDFM